MRLRLVEAPAAVGRRNILSGCVILIVYRDGGVIMHRYLLAISAGWHGRYIGEFILHAVDILIKGVGKAFFIGVGLKWLANTLGPA